MRHLRDAQVQCLHKLGRAAVEDFESGANRELVIAIATGGGKSIAIKAILGYLIGLGLIRSAIIACPQIQIKDGFEGEQETFSFPGGTVTVPWVSTRKEGLSGFLRKEGGPEERGSLDPCVVAVCHKYLMDGIEALEKHVEESGPECMRGRALVIDEFHRAAGPDEDGRGANLLWRFAKKWGDAGGLLIKASATQDRHDGRPTVDETDYVQYVKTLVELMISGEAPAKFESHMVKVDGFKGTSDGRTKEIGVLRSEDAEQASVVVAEEMVRKYLEVKYPKLIVQLRSGDSSTNRLYVEAVMKAFRSAVKADGSPVRVYDATDVKFDEKDENTKRFSEVLRREKELVEAGGYEASEIDVIVGMQRVVEGTDWPVCAAVFRVGMPTSLPFLRQLIGRGSRWKKGFARYPSAWADKFCCYLFVAQMDDPDTTHSRQVLLTSVFLSSVSTDLETWSLFRTLHRFTEKFPKAGDRNNADTVSDWVPPEEERPYFDAAHQTVMASHLKGRWSDKEPEDILKAIMARSDGKFSRRSAKFWMGKKAYEKDEKVREYVESALNEAAEHGRLDAKAVEECMASVLKRFKDTSLYLVPDHSAAEHVHEMTGHSMMDLAEQVRAKIPLFENDLRKMMKRTWDSLEGKSTKKGSVEWAELAKSPTFREFDEAMKRPGGARGLAHYPGGARKYVFDLTWSLLKRSWSENADPVASRGPEAAFYKKAVLLASKSKYKAFVEKVLGDDVLLAEDVGCTWSGQDLAEAVREVSERVAAGMSPADAVAAVKSVVKAA
jgi:hypothetical protein